MLEIKFNFVKVCVLSLFLANLITLKKESVIINVQKRHLHLINIEKAKQKIHNVQHLKHGYRLYVTRLNIIILTSSMLYSKT